MVKTLINLSGGLDSTYCLWKYLIENEKPILVHHMIGYSYSSQRWEKEKQCVDNILDWLCKQGLIHFDYIESELDISFSRRRPLDSTVIGFMTGCVLLNKAYPDIDTVIIGTPKDEYIRLGYEELTRRKEISSQITNLVLQSKQVDKIIHYTYPIKNMYKKQIIEDIPKDLYDLTWSCRKPKDGKPCLRCHTCKQIFDNEEIIG